MAGLASLCQCSGRSAMQSGWQGSLVELSRVPHRQQRRLHRAVAVVTILEEQESALGVTCTLRAAAAPRTGRAGRAAQGTSTPSAASAACSRSSAWQGTPSPSQPSQAPCRQLHHIWRCAALAHRLPCAQRYQMVPDRTQCTGIDWPSQAACHHSSNETVCSAAGQSATSQLQLASACWLAASSSCKPLTRPVIQSESLEVQCISRSVVRLQHAHDLSMSTNELISRPALDTVPHASCPRRQHALPHQRLCSALVLLRSAPRRGASGVSGQPVRHRGGGLGDRRLCDAARLGRKHPRAAVGQRSPRP